MNVGSALLAYALVLGFTLAIAMRAVRYFEDERVRQGMPRYTARQLSWFFVGAGALAMLFVTMIIVFGAILGPRG